jgi:hypothetical protein
MPASIDMTPAQLTDALHALGIRFIFYGDRANGDPHAQPVRLLAGLASSNEARLRLALIPLFLEHPEFAVHAVAAAKSLAQRARLTLQCYYTAALWLQRENRFRLETLLGKQPPLPDLFSSDLGLASMQGDPALALQNLAIRHQALSGEKANWLGTYRHALQVWMRAMENTHA